MCRRQIGADVRSIALQYISTRGDAPALNFEEVLLAGLANDGGLYVPETWPRFEAGDLEALAGKSYQDVAFRVMWPFVNGVSEARFREILSEAYGGFSHSQVAPLRQIGPDHWLMELFHGPTLAFKDVAMQLLGRLFDDVLKRRSDHVTIVGATSGDTGAAAIEACRDRDAIEIFIMHPLDRVSDVQRRQMTTVAAGNVHNIAVEGTFDDCQALLKGLFNDAVFRERVNLSAVNSINWARVMAQIVYYVYAAVALGAPARKPRFVVPTGNFGDIFAGYGAVQMGLPVRGLVVATNQNDILHRFFTSGEYRPGVVQPSQSPSMDIQVASNFERLLFDLCDRDGHEVTRLMGDLGEQGHFIIGDNRRARARALFDSTSVDEAKTTETIRQVAEATGIIIDPHTAVGVAAAWQTDDGLGPTVTLATAHPAKFSDAVHKATGSVPELPDHLADLHRRDERYSVLPNDLKSIKAHIAKEIT